MFQLAHSCRLASGPGGGSWNASLASALLNASLLVQLTAGAGYWQRLLRYDVYCLLFNQYDYGFSTMAK
jgi:hypothetical protein